MKKKPWIGVFVLVTGGIVLLLLAGLTQVRYDLEGLQAVSGRVIEADSRKPGRHSGYSLHLTVEAGGRRVLLEQQEVGGYAHRLAAGQSIRAWIDPQPARPGDLPVHTVWQIERGGQVVMPVLAVGDELHDRILWEYLLGGFLLISGLIVAAKNWPRAALDESVIESEARP
jgi:hypothetical protein